ncbi:poly-gamma-glutamate biosynthesis protein PgsC [bacterium]|nr:poly-gamma-glutamate biosynthesis protein PgsC [bacterium]
MAFELPFIGLVLTLIFISVTGVYPGGLIIPSYLTLFIDQPLRLAGTLTAAVVTFLCYRLLSRWWILFGRRRFIFMIMTGAMWAQFALIVLPQFFNSSMEFRIIGWIIPGLIANQFERQGVLITILSLITVTIATYIIALLLGLK